MITQGIRANLGQFTLLVITNAFVGGMVGLERTVLPLVAEQEFGIASKSAILTFLISFGIVKALTNVSAGYLADRLGRRRLLIGGWLLGLPVPFLIIFARSWDWVIAANILLGMNQGLCWSMTVVMKLDLAGPRQRGLALGLNECSGYSAVALAALGSAYLAGAYGLRPAPFYVGIGLAVAGLIVSWGFIRETHGHVHAEGREPSGGGSRAPSFGEVFSRTSWGDRSLFSCSQAGLINNFNDSMAWGLLPLFFAAAGLDLGRIGVLTATYPAVWGVSQLATGALSDRWGRKWMIVGGMWLQAGAIWMIVGAPGFGTWLAGAVVLGLGTGLVYPTLIAAVSDVARPAWRATSVGVYRLWRDLGFAIGAIIVGTVADRAGVSLAIILVGVLTAMSGIIVALLMTERPPTVHPGQTTPHA